MSHRPLAIVTGLTVGDYFLWNWSLGGSHDVIALVSGLTLPPLAAASVWLIALTVTRLLGRAARHQPKARQSRAIARSRRALRRATAEAAHTGGPAAPGTATLASSPTSFAPRQSSSSGKLAA